MTLGSEAVTDRDDVGMRKETNASRQPMNQDCADGDEAPDLSAPEWRRIVDATPVTRGRPKSARPKISTTIRLDADIVAHFRTGGPGWQSRINQALRAGMARR